MMRHMLPALILTFAPLALSSCAYPKTQVMQGQAAPSIYFVGHSEGAEVFVDNQPVGYAADFDGEKGLLSVTPGAHIVVVRANGADMFRKEVFVGRTGTLEIDLATKDAQ